jgi:predicted amidohydrolase
MVQGEGFPGQVIRAGVLQLPIQWATGEERQELLADLLREGKNQGLHLAVLPEISLTGYDLCDKVGESADTIPGTLTDRLASLTRELQLTVVAGMTEAVENDLYNTLIVCDSLGFRGSYRKVHVSTLENACWKPGETPGIVTCDLGRIGLGICADMVYRTPWEWFQAEPADIIAISAAWPDFRSTHLPLSRRFSQYHHDCLTLLPRQISEVMGAPVLFSNYHGRLPVPVPITRWRLPVTFAGGSWIAGGHSVAVVTGQLECEWGISEVQLATHSKRPEKSQVQRWLPDTNDWIRGQFYLGETLSQWLLKGVYHYRRKVRSGSKD